MEKEIINLELSEKVGIIDCLGEGVIAFFKNLIPFLKMLLPLLWVILSSILLSIAAFFTILSMASDFLVFKIISVLLLIFSACIFGYSFWRYLIGMVAVSYLAKDIYENQEIQSSKAYYGYVETYSSNYAKYWLYNAALSFIWLALFIYICGFAYYILHNYISYFLWYLLFILLFIIISVPFLIGLNFSIFFFAYQDKENPFNLILYAVKLSYKKAFPLFWYLFLLNILIIILGGLLYKISPLLSSLFSMFASYFTIFVTTRYYFDIIKD